MQHRIHGFKQFLSRCMAQNPPTASSAASEKSARYIYPTMTFAFNHIINYYGL